VALTKLDIKREIILTREALWRKRLAVETRCLRRRRADGKSATYYEGPHAKLSRVLLKMVGLFAKGVENAKSPVFRELTFDFATLPAAFDGFRILHLSDFHFDDRPGLVEAMGRVVEGIAADLCVLTGDYRFNRQAPCRSVYAGMRKLLSGLTVRDGILAILGNNDMSDCIPSFRAMGIRMLVNESFELARNGQSIWFAGVDDPHEFRCDSVFHAVEAIPPGAFTILLAHSPEIIPQAAEYGIDLYLCGHTHGGQVCLPRIGPLYLNARCARTYSAGVWGYGNLQGFTTTGIGASTLPVRFNCPPEAALLSLRKT
jgi:predicted MPP superfamily phosphohydrolase